MTDDLASIIANTPEETFKTAGAFGWTDQVALALEAYWRKHKTGPVIVSRLELAWLLEGYARARLANDADTELIWNIGHHLTAMCDNPYNYENRYNDDVGAPCPGCYDAREAYAKWVTQQDD